MTYDLIVLGGGAAGLTASGVAANFGARTCLIERHRLGGDCTWTGCIPSKTLLHAAHVAHTSRTAGAWGIRTGEVEVDFPALMDRLRGIRDEVYHDADRPEIYERMGVDVRHGTARFVDAHTVEIESDGGTERLRADRFVVATGARAAAPPIPGLDTVPYLTNETLFEIERLPRRLAIVGAGPIGTEMAQAFRRLGSEVVVVDQADRILGHDDAELAEHLRRVLVAEGVEYRLGAEVRRIGGDPGAVRVEIASAGGEETIEADALLVAAGRRPNIEDLGLEALGVETTKRGITVDDRCRTNARHVWAVGDVTGRYQFTHMSEHMAKVAVSNAILKVPMKIDAAHVPWVTYTDPELAHVGETEEQLRQRGARFTTFRFPYAKVDRAITEGQTEGLIKLHARPLTGRILGASILGARAGELVSEYAVAMRGGVTARQIADTIHPYPTYALAARRAADQYYIRQHKPWMVRLLKRVFGYGGQVNTYEEGEVV